jgi:hypothetical protein
MTCVAVAEEDMTDMDTIQALTQLQTFDTLMPPYSAVTIRIYGNATLMVNNEVVHDGESLHIFEDEEFIVSMQPEYGFYLVLLEFEGESLLPISSTAYKGDIQKDGTLIALLTRWNADIPVTFSIAEPYHVYVYGREVQDQETMYCYPKEEIQLFIDTPANTDIAVSLNGKTFAQIDERTYTISVMDPGILRIEEYIPVEREELSMKKRFVRRTPACVLS